MGGFDEDVLAAMARDSTRMVLIDARIRASALTVKTPAEQSREYAAEQLADWDARFAATSAARPASADPLPQASPRPPRP